MASVPLCVAMWNVMKKYAQSVFSLYDIPYFVDMKSSILYHPCIELIRAVLEIVEKRFFSMKGCFVFCVPVCPDLQKQI